MAVVIILSLLAFFPIKLPIAVKTTKLIQTTTRPRKARSPTHHQSLNYWEPPWEDDDEDL